MKSGPGRKKQRRAAKASKQQCGTLTYIAECRGMLPKPGMGTIVAAAADSMNRIVRKYPAVK